MVDVSKELWTPTQTAERPVKPSARKDEGGTWFDDELETQTAHDNKLRAEMFRLIDHINKRPDHTVYVSCVDERAKMRKVFNMWRKMDFISGVPRIEIDYGIAEGGIRVDV